MNPTASPSGLIWVLDRFRDVLQWPLNFVGQGGKRFGRLLGAISAFSTISSATQLGAWLHAVVVYSFDLIGGAELVQLLWRSVTICRPLTDSELEAAYAVFGSYPIRYGSVRIAHGGMLSPIFRANNNRAFATWHTINLPAHRQDDIPLLIHELTHTLQYERVGSIYIGQGLWAQRKLGRDAYRYGGSGGLAKAYAAGIQYSDYNREQQGQIAQDYCARLQAGRDIKDYEPFIDELRAGAV